MKLKKLLSVMFFAFAMLVTSTLFVACGDKPELSDYDMSAVTFLDKTVTYNGQAQTLSVGGTLPQGVTVAYEYYKDTVSAANKLSNNPINAGTYKVVAKFAGDSNHNAISDMTATLKIEKADLNITLGANQYVDGNKYVDLKEPVIFEKNQDGIFSHEYDGKEYAISVVDSNANSDDLKVKFFTTQEAAENNDSQNETGDVIKNVGVTIYARVECEGDNFNSNISIIGVTIVKRVVYISNAQELDLLRTEMKTVDIDVLYNTRYILTQDIDYDEQVWVTLGAANERAGWVGEFDGNGHKIYNFTITEASLGDTDVTTASNGISFGFWGFLKDAYIHDVTFDDFTVNIDVEKINGYVAQGSAANPICFGIIAGRTRYSSILGTHFENILVSNANIHIITKGGFYGTIIGEEYAGQLGADEVSDEDKQDNNLQESAEGRRIIRKNLDVKNVTIQAASYVDKIRDGDLGRLSIGGLVGELMFDTHVFEDCDIDGITLINGDEFVKDKVNALSNAMGANLGGFIGFDFTTWKKGLFKNCTIHNFRLEDWTGRTDMATYVGCTALDWFHQATGTGSEFNGCMATNDDDPKYGLFLKTYSGSQWEESSGGKWNELLMKQQIQETDYHKLLVDDRTPKD